MITIIVFILGALLLLGVLMVMLHYLQPAYLFEYLIFLRYPILCALSLMLLPLIATWLLPTFIANLFIVDDWIGFALIAAFAVLCSWVIMFTSGLIIVGAPKRFGLHPIKIVGAPKRFGLHPVKEETDAQEETGAQEEAKPKANYIVCIVSWLWKHPEVKGPRPALGFRQLWWYDFRKNFNFLATIFPLLLNLSLLVDLYEQVTFSSRLWGFVIGFVAAFFVGVVVLTLIVLIQLYFGKLGGGGWSNLQRIAAKWFDKVDVRNIPGVQQLVGTFHDGYMDLGETPFTHRRAIFLFLAAGMTYGVGYSLFNPAHPNFLVRHVPPLIYFILLIALAALILPSLSYYFDRYRAPVVLIIFAIYLISYFVPGADHYYEFTAPTTPSAASTQSMRTPRDVVAAWDRRYRPDQHPIMVVVAASGGGIKAAMWTARVLAALRSDPELGKPFAESITLVSTVSGGSVGGMYVLDQYRQPELTFTNAVSQTSESSLNAIAWGIAYPDLLRTIVPLNWLVGKTNDRGAATEHAWRAQFANEPPTLLMWPQTIEKQWQPLQVFNTTIAETGQRLLLSPIEISSPFTTTAPFARAKNFVTLYEEGCDLSVVTAARLSATFPYVTPIAQPLATETCAKDPETRYHLADGGYYDNFGIMTVLEFLSALTPQAYKEQFQRRKILLIQIRADPSEDMEPWPASADGFKYATFGPGLTALQVQTVTQIGRNDLELEMLKQNWASDGITIETVAFELRKEVALSWHLSDTEKQDITQEFYNTYNQCNLKKLKRFWGVPNPTGACR